MVKQYSDIGEMMAFLRGKVQTVELKPRKEPKEELKEEPKEEPKEKPKKKKATTKKKKDE